MRLRPRQAFLGTISERFEFGRNPDHCQGVLLGCAVHAVGLAGASLWIGRAGGKSWLDNAEQIIAC